jgi:hypothetical protein
MPRKREVRVDVAGEARDEAARPRQSDESDVRARQRRPQGPQSRHGAQHVAELQGAKHRQAPRCERL